jgi:hypothetical protein
MAHSSTHLDPMSRDFRACANLAEIPTDVHRATSRCWSSTMIAGKIAYGQAAAREPSLMPAAAR